MKSQPLSTKPILYITYDGATDHIGQAQILPYLYGLASKGFRLTLLSVEKESRLALYPNLRTQLAAKQIDWQYLVYTQKPPVLSSIYDIARVQRLAFKIAKQKKIGVVHCRSYMASLVGLKLKQQLGIKFIFDKRDFWADAGAETKRFDRQHPLLNQVYLFFKRKEKTFIQHADCIISLTHNAKSVVEQWDFYNKKNTSIEVIPCCTDLSFFDTTSFNKSEITAKGKELNIKENDFVLVYSGSIGAAYMVDEMLSFFKQLHQLQANAKLLLILNNPTAELTEKIEAQGTISTAVVLTSTHREGMPLLLALADAAIFFIFPTFAKRASSPTKFGEFLAMQLPIVCNADVGDNHLIVNEYGVGWAIAKHTEETYLTTAKQLLEADKKLLKKRARQCAKDYFDLNRGVEKLSEIYTKLLMDE